MSGPRGLAFDVLGNLYVANSGDNTIEKFDSNGNGTLFANATAGLNSPQGLAFASTGDLYVANNGNNTIQKITPAGVGTVFANVGLNQPYGLAFDRLGNLYVASFGNSTIAKYAPDGTPSVFADSGDGLNSPLALAFDTNGNVYASNYGNNTITKLTPAGSGSVFANSGLNGPWGLAIHHSGSLYVVDELAFPNEVKTFNTSLSPPVTGTLFANSGLSDPGFIAINPGLLPVVALAPVVKTITRVGATVTITIDSQSGLMYQLQRGTTPAAASFTTNIGGPQPGSTGNVLTFTDPNATANRLFYRIAVSL